jgi:CRP/FNR family cyclic AMP-dependent transcriptional regulator
MTSTHRKFELFRHASPARVYPAKAVIFKAGDEGHVMYAVKRGRVAVVVEGNAVDTLEEFEVFGEMALLEQKTRSATIVALEETELVEIGQPQFYMLVRENPPFALQIMQLLSERLRRADALYALYKPDEVT